MEGLVKRYFWVFNLLALALLAYLTARVVNNVVAGKIAALETKPSKVAAGKVGPEVKRNKRDWADTIANRNLFNSEPPEDEGFADDGDGGADSGPADTGGDDWPKPGQECEESKAKLGVLATMVAQPTDWSMAVIDDPEADSSRVMKEGQRVADALLVSIQRNRVVLRNEGKWECVALGTKAKGGRKRKSTAPSKSSSKSNDNIKDGIKKVGKNKYEIDRNMLDEQLADLGKLSKGARVIPHYRDGKPQGFKIVGVRPGSLYSHIGVRSGDVIKSVSDEEITSPTKALELFEKLKNTENVTVDVERRGRKMTLEYDIK